MTDLQRLHIEVRDCRRCVDAGFIGQANPVFRGMDGHRLMIVGQAPGERGHLNSVPYAGATGVALRSWLERAGFDTEDPFDRFYLTSITKCFPGPSATGKGDRAPSSREIALCATHLGREISIVRPELVLTLGRIAATRLICSDSLSDLVGTVREVSHAGHRFLALPLPHPSGVSHWLNVHENRCRLDRALARLSDLRVRNQW